MIPKVIHYCWFGEKPLDELALKCIESWKKFFPDYKIVQWNEENFDVSQMDFMKKAYDEKKWAFVSDVARLLVVYRYGGLYFDTDVEVISEYNDILHEKISGFLGFEKTNAVSTGLGFGAIPKHPFIGELIDVYEKLDFEQHMDRLSEIACPIITTQLLQQKGYIVEDKKQECCGFEIFPSEYFAPIDYFSGKMKKTNHTHSIHWYNASWISPEEKKEQQVIQRFHHVLGVKLGDSVYGIFSCVRKEGLISYILKRIKKFTRHHV